MAISLSSKMITPKLNSEPTRVSTDWGYSMEIDSQTAENTQSPQDSSWTAESYPAILPVIWETWKFSEWIQSNPCPISCPDNQKSKFAKGSLPLWASTENEIVTPCESVLVPMFDGFSTTTPSGRMVLVPGFEPGSPPRKGGMMDRTTPHERRCCRLIRLV